ncbi:hypothetical protein WG66_003237 [Moniliophthora roreri]|nr:hypothetical protein WG66_003237 [Moniliophthora roreri]
MDRTSVDRVYNLWIDAYIFDGLAAMLIQFYFAYRIHILLFRTKLIPGIVLSLSVAQFAGAVSTGSIIKGFTFFSNSQDSNHVPGFVWIVASTIADVLISVTMIYAVSHDQSLHYPA